MRFANNDSTAAYATTPLKTEEWALFPTYHGGRITRIRIGRVSPEIEVEWLARVILSERC